MKLTSLGTEEVKSVALRADVIQCNIFSSAHTLWHPKNTHGCYDIYGDM